MGSEEDKPYHHLFQSPDQSLSQSKGEQIHPELEAIVLKWAYIGRTTDATREESILGAINELNSLSQSPAPSKEMEERIDEIVAREIAYESMQFWRDDLKKILTAFAAELGKEREEIRYQAACSGLWYEKASAAGTLKAIQIGSSIYQIPNVDPLIEEIVRLKRGEMARAALAETPDVSMLDRVVQVLEVAVSQEPMSFEARDVIRRLLSTLQPDHQK